MDDPFDIRDVLVGHDGWIYLDTENLSFILYNYEASIVQSGSSSTISVIGSVFSFPETVARIEIEEYNGIIEKPFLTVYKVEEKEYVQQGVVSSLRLVSPSLEVRASLFSEDDGEDMDETQSQIYHRANREL